MKDEKTVRELYKKMRGTENLSNDYYLVFQITDACNFRCRYCYENKNVRSLPLNSMLTLVDKFFDPDSYDTWWRGILNKEVEKKTHVILRFFGGECTLEMLKMDAVIERFVKHCKENPEKYAKRLEDLEIIIETNASLLKTDACIAFFDKWVLKEKLYLHVSISIDGIREAHDSGRVFKDTEKPTFDIVYENTLWFAKRYPSVKINIKSTLNSESVKYYYESYKFLKKLMSDIKSDHINIQPAVGIKWQPEDARVLREQLNLIIKDMVETGYSLPFMGVSNRFEDIMDDNSFLRSEILLDNQFPGNCIGGCFSTTNTGVAISVDENLYTCEQFAPLTTGDDHMAIGNIRDGITAHGLEVMETIHNAINLHLLEEENCGACYLGARCSLFCPAFNYKSTKDVNRPRESIDENECNVLREFSIASFKLRFYMEQKKYVI